jgi:hypothetical protein
MSQIRLAGLIALLLPAAAFANPEYEVRITGQVTAGEDAVPYEGARIDALEDGILLRGTAWTDEAGRYELLVPRGIYDLRAVPATSARISSFARDIDLQARAPHAEDFWLPSLEDVLRDSGIELEDLADRDYDAVPDSLEGSASLDWELSDSDEDGVFDGLAGWVGADPLRGRIKTEAIPELLWPVPGEEMEVEHPLVRSGVTPPMGMLFRAVPGATGYRLRVHSKTGRTEWTWDHHFTDGELLLGEGVSLRWVPPSGWEAGGYEMELQGFYYAPDRPVGGVATIALRLFEVDELDPLEIAEGEEIEFFGLHLASTVRVREGAKVIVPEGETLQFVATGTIIIERGARIVGAAGASVVISTARDLLAQGPISAGDGAPGAEAKVGPGAEKEASVATAESGASGGDVLLVALGTIFAGSEARISSGTGGAGGGAEAKAAVGGDALAVGGNGGRGGRLLLHASALQVADRRGHLHCGAGGAGGDALAQGGDGAKDIQSGLSSALPGVGGDSGDIWISNWNLRRDGFVALYDESFPAGGGNAGAPGQAFPSYGSEGEFDGVRSRRGRPHEMISELSGGSGWYRAGDGQVAIARGGEGLGNGEGGLATARGGRGGYVRRIGLSGEALALVFGFLPSGGNGGAADATGGFAGKPTGGSPGDGGSAVAEGGAGGVGLLMPLSIFSAGGNGGDALARGMPGMQGPNRCPGLGRAGSAGGSAEATGGAGGFANYLGGAGGDATGDTRDGGNGGMGHGGGQGGRGGRSQPRGGERGGAWLYRGQGGESGGTKGKRGKRGPSCPN